MKKKFWIYIPERWDRLVQLEAESKEEAIQLIKNGEIDLFDLDDDNIEYVPTDLDHDNWTIEQV